MHGIQVAFREWASQYDNPEFEGRNRAWHEAWLAGQTAPILRVDGDSSAEAMTAKVIHALSQVSR
ncbi:hypothetical protein RTW82_18545 [Pseudomonas sp. zfem005]|nr:hypothetical protein [Pseudomonas sp. zfem005]MDU9414333.1 hypothetical protein [Pseudomonas sp. zfem005]